MKLRIINKLLGAMIAMSLNCFLHSTPIEVTAEGLCWIEGVKYAAVGFGTFPLKDETCFTAVEIASECRYGIIDTATYYGNLFPYVM